LLYKFLEDFLGNFGRVVALTPGKFVAMRRRSLVVSELGFSSSYKLLGRHSPPFVTKQIFPSGLPNSSKTSASSSSSGLLAVINWSQSPADAEFRKRRVKVKSQRPRSVLLPLAILAITVTLSLREPVSDLKE
jgi:hypothetical protein